MVERRQLQELVIRNVVHGNVIGKGANGKIFKGTWEGAPCAIKEIHSIFAEVASEEELAAFKSAFIEECRRSSKLRHPNIVQFLGVYFRPQAAAGLPCLVMELLHSDLTKFLSGNPEISYEIKLSILHDVTLGLRFLHNSTPSIIHRDLSSNNVLISRGYVAKIGDLGTARFLNPNHGTRMSQLTKAPGTVDFMSPEVLFDNPKYGTPLDVFSFACVSLHTITHQWPTPTAPVYTDPVTNILLPRSEVERRSSLFDKFDEETLSLKPLLVRCLNNDPKARPTMIEVCDSLMKLKGSGIKMPLQNGIEKVKSGNTATCWDQLRKVWGKCASLPEKVQVGTVAVINGKVYVKGYGQDFTFRYCSVSDSWSALPILPLFSYSLTASGKYLLAIGGISYFNKKICNGVRLFDPSDNCWHDDYISSKMKIGRFDATSVGYQSWVIVVGGITDIDMTTTQTVEILKVVSGNLSSSHWYRVQSMPFGAGIPMTAIINNTLYVAGGYTLHASTQYMTSVPITELVNSKDGMSKVWSDVSALPCSTSSFTSYKEHLLIFGGDYITGASNKQYTWQAVSSIYMYHLETKQWEKVGKIPCDFYLGRCAHLTSSKIIFVGGQTDVSSTSSDVLLTQCMTLQLDDELQSAKDHASSTRSNSMPDSSSSTPGPVYDTVKSCRQQ